MCTGAEALILTGGVMKAAGAYQPGRAVGAASEYNARLAEGNAVLTRKQAAEEERRFRITARKRTGAIEAAYAASGVTLEGSPMAVLAEDMFTAEHDAITIREAGEARARAYESEARLMRMEGRAGRVTGALGAASALIGGAAEIF